MKQFVKTVAIVTVFSVCEKFLGFLYRIFLSRSIGSQGIGVYQVALSVFALLMTLCSSGTPITVSRLMTKYQAQGNKARVERVISAGLLFTVAVALPLSIILFFFYGKLGFMFADDNAQKIFFIVLPSLAFTSVYSVLRGVFWGDKDFLPYSVIELLEEICMIVVGVILISRTTDVISGAMRAGVAVFISYLFSFLLASLAFFFRKHRLTNPKNELKPLLKSAMPVTAMRTANSLIGSLVSIVLPLRLVASGMSQAQAMSLFGASAGQAIPILTIPTTLIGSFTLVLVPEIAENYYRNDHLRLKTDIEKAIKFTFILSCVFVPVFIVCGQEIGILVFNSHNCGKYLTASAFLMLFMSLSSISTSILNSIGQENKTLLFFVISGIFMLISIWFLPSVIGVYALLVGFTCVYGITTLLNFILLAKNCVQKPRYVKFCLQATALIIPTVIFGLILETLLLKLLGTFFTFVVCALACVAFYGLICFGFNLINFEIIKNKLGNFSFFQKKIKKQKA